MRKFLILAVVIIVLIFVPAIADKPGKIKELENRVQQLEKRLDGYEMLKVEVSNLESFVNFILSQEYVEMICDYCKSKSS